MDIHPVSAVDGGQVRDLWEYCFDDSRAFTDFYFKQRFQPENTLAVYDGSRICSCLQMLPYRIMIRGRVFDCSYIVGVSTWPEYRGKGMAGRLLRAATYELAARNHPVSVLLPFQYDFYRKYGWETCYEQILYDDIGTGFMGTAINDCSFKPAVLPDDMQALEDCYFGFMSAYNGYIYRDSEDWLRLFNELKLSKGAACLLKSGNKYDGYIIYTIDQRVLHIKECVFQSPEARQRLLALAASHYGGQVERISMSAPQDDLTYLTMPDPRGLMQKRTYAMGRIHDAAAVLSDMPVPMQLELVLKINDGLCKQNDGCFRIETVNGKTRAARTSAAPAAELSVGTLAQLSFGYLTPVQALRNGLIRVSGREAADSIEILFPRVTPYIIEDY